MNHAIVKAVTSGDTVLLMGQKASSNGPPPEKSITLSSLMAPKLGYGDTRPDEPFAFQSREFLRKLLIGKKVQFKVEYSVPAIKRDFGAIYFNGQSVCKEVVKNGWASVKSIEKSRDGVSEDFDELQNLQESARSSKLGMWGATPSTVTNRRGAFDADKLFQEVENKPLAAVVEWVRDAGSARCYIPSKNITVMVNMAGIQTPRLARTVQPGVVKTNAAPPAPSTANNKAPLPSSTTADPVLMPAEPFAAQAKHFVEVRLLHRDVCVRLHAVDRNDSFFGSIEHPAGDIRQVLLTRGLAKCSDWSIRFLQLKLASSLRAAEKSAKNKRLNVWKSYVPPTIHGDKEFIGTVGECLSADTFIILVGDQKRSKIGAREARRISLSSVRTPRLGRRDRDEAEPWAFQSKEYMRNLLIGKSVRVTVEYTRSSNNNSNKGGTTTTSTLPPRVYATINLQNKSKRNVAEALVGEGLGEVIRHRQGEERSGEYDKLLAAEAKAKQNKKCIHSSKDAPIVRINDISRSAHKAKAFFPFLQRNRNTKAIVEYVYSATRLRLFIPDHNCICNFALIGVRTPNSSRPPRDGQPGRDAEPFSREANLLTREKVLQREVIIDTEDIDKMGTFLGGLYYAFGRNKRNLLASELLENGYGKILHFSAERSSTYDELLSSEEIAKSTRLNVWKNFDAEQLERAKRREEAEVSDGTGSGGGSDCRDVVISHMNDATDFYLHYTLSEKENLANLATQMKVYETEVAPFVSPAKHAFCAAPFDEGNGSEWYRGRIEELIKDNKNGTQTARILFIDYGNTADVPVAKLKTLSPELLSIKPLAHAAKFAFVKIPMLNEEYGEDAAIAFDKMAWGKDLVAIIHSRDNEARDVVTLQYKEDLESTVTEGMLKQGFARLKRNYKREIRPSDADKTIERVFESFDKAQMEARTNHCGIWRYGDIDSDDEGGI